MCLVATNNASGACACLRMLQIDGAQCKSLSRSELWFATIFGIDVHSHVYEVCTGNWLMVSVTKFPFIVHVCPCVAERLVYDYMTNPHADNAHASICLLYTSDAADE